MLALARAWMCAGHDAALAAPSSFAARAAAVGIPFVPLGPDAAPGELHRAQAAALSAHDAPAQAKSMVDSLLPTLPRMVRELSDACAASDVLVGFPYQLAAPIVRDLQSVCFASIHFSPFGGSRRIAEAVAPSVNACRAEMGLPPVADPLGADATSNRLALYALSAHVFRRPRRWPAHHHLTGFLFLDEDTRIDPALERFVAAGEPPVVITFGSMVHADADQTTALLVDAVLRSGRRAVLQRGWSGLGRGALPDVIHSTDFVPHGWLFPRASCVVHAGGAGTTAATLRAGIPTVVVPHWLDQPIWAELARELGCAGAVLPVRALEAEALARAISDTLGSQRCADKARELSAKIAAEDGTAVACTLLEELVRSG